MRPVEWLHTDTVGLAGYDILFAYFVVEAVLLIYTFWYVNIANVTAGYGYWKFITLSKFYKLCVMVEVY